jgi:hypothetical protein
MPYHKDWSELYLTNRFHLHPEGWEPLTIEYGYDDIGAAQYFYWRVAETKHTFKSAVSSFNQETGGDYATYIERFLVQFRDELVGWALQSEKTEWSKEYITEYNKWIKF